MKRIITILISTFFVIQMFGQQPSLSLGPWHLTNYFGEYELKGIYRNKEYIYTSITEQQKFYDINHRFALNTESYVWHPNFMIISADFEFSPGKYNNDYLVAPDNSEVRTMNKIDLRTTFFQNKPVTLTLFANINDSYQNRENLTNIKTNSKQWGAIFHSKKALPFSLRYNKGEWNQQEITTGRMYKNEFSNFEGRMNKSFTTRDKNEFVYTYNNFSRKDYNDFVLNNWYNRLSLINSYNFDFEQKYQFKSMINYMDQKGDNIFNRFDVTERLYFKLPKKFKLTTTYKYYDLSQELQRTTRNTGMLNVNHQLYESLNSTVFGEINATNHTVYDENIAKAGINFIYDKKIPYGHLNITYNYYYQHLEMISASRTINRLNIPYVLNDQQVVMFTDPYIDINSVVVRDVTGTILYQENFDYILVEVGNFIEIQRVPGGQIQNAQTVYVDYVAIQPGNYNYDMYNISFATTLSFFERLVDLYYRRTTQDYFNIVQTDFLTLNYLVHNVYGTRLKVGPVSGGVEYDDYNSSITPYYMWKYYLEFNKRFKDDFMVSLRANKRDYFLVNERIINKYNDINLRLTYNLRRFSKVELMTGYRENVGPGRDLKLYVARLEYSTVYRKIYLSLGAEVYKRDYLSDIVNFNGFYIKLLRRFN